MLGSPLGLLLALLPHAVYGFYLDVPRLWGLSPLVDQQIAGVTMASEQSIVLFAVFAFYLLQVLRRGEQRGHVPRSDRQTRQPSITLMSASSGWIAHSITAFPLALRTSSRPMFFPRNRW